VIGIDQRIADDDVEERLQNLTSLWVDCAGDTFDSTTTSETSDSWLSDASENVFLFRSVLGLSKTFSLTLTRHYEVGVLKW